MKWIVLLIIMMVAAARADDINLKYGFGLPETGDLTQVKYISIGYQTPVSRLFRLKGDLGGWFDAAVPNRNSGFISGAVGMRVEPGYFYVDNYFGVAFINRIDDILGLPFEFTEELGFGIKDSAGRTTGLQWKHFSNAGLSPINKGRDFILVNIGIPLL